MSKLAFSHSSPLSIELRGTGDNPPVAIIWGGVEVHFIEKVGNMPVLEALIESLNKRLDRISPAVDAVLESASDLAKLWDGSE